MHPRIIKNSYKKLMLLGASLGVLLTITACQKLDVIGNDSVTSFGEMIDAVPELLTEDTELKMWNLEAPDGGAKFVWSKDFDSNTGYDAMLEIDSKPFVNAGLDVTLLPEGMVQGEALIVGVDFEVKETSNAGDITPLMSYEQIVFNQRDLISHHSAMDHFGISIGHGNMFEWAKDMSSNDKDIVFVLDPEVLITAGVKPEDVDGWVFAEVETMHMSGKKTVVEKFLKPFDLK